MPLEGVVDEITSEVIRGWAYDPERPDRPVEIVVLVDGEPRWRLTAREPRRDLADAGKGDGRHGFTITADPPIRPDRTAVRFAETEEPLHGSPTVVPSAASLLMRPRAESPLLERLIEREGIPAEKAELVRRFGCDGYLKFRIADPDFDRLACSAVEDMDWSKSDGIRIQDAWTEVEAVQELAALPEVMELLELLYGRAPIPFQTLNFPVGTQQATHTDTIHFNSNPPRFMCGVWIALEDIDERNGALHYYPGSHRLPVYDLDDLGIDARRERMNANYELYLQLLRELIEARGLKKEIGVMQRGEAIVWAANLYHGGEPILEPGRSRHSQVTHYYFEGCAYYEPMTSNRYLGRLTRPDRRDVRTGAPIPHMFRDVPVPDAAGTDARAAPSILRRLAHRVLGR